MAEKILDVKKLNVKLGEEEIIKDLSFQLEKGDALTLLGPNGAGKSTLLKVILGVLPYTGSIEKKKGMKIGYVPQRLPFIKDVPMSVREFIKIKEQSEEKIEKIFQSVGFERNFLEKQIGTLSSGQFQRVLIAWALVKDPEVLLFDEPTTGIDIRGKETVYRLLEKLKKERNLTIVLVTHDLSVVFKFSNYVICLNRFSSCKGKPREILTPENLQSIYGEEVKFYKHHN